MRYRVIVAVVSLALLLSTSGQAQRTVKPVLHGKHWIAITGKPLAATAGAMIFAQGVWSFRSTRFTSRPNKPGGMAHCVFC